MTTRERTALQGFINRLTEIREKEEKYFNELKALNDGKTMSAEINYREIIRKYPESSAKVTQATLCYKAVMALRGEEENLRELGAVLADLDFWKK